MKVEFAYDINREFKNFKNSFKSVNHPNQSPRQKEFFSFFPELNEENSKKFVEGYLKRNKIDMSANVKIIEKNWRPVERKFFDRAEKIFRKKLPNEKIMVWLTIHDRCSYSFERNEFFIHLHFPAVNKTIMHELWHFYFYHTVGKKISDDFGPKIFNDIKEALTVLLNIEFSDILMGVEDKGYPQHTELRKQIVQLYKESNDIYKTIEGTLKVII
ncbi:hypothetical protein JW977_01175 [Candidatus Falkowbacteria bacterium]|nr:hypothetical protein [Candidatus Falkowbacteria bacterium]